MCGLGDLLFRHAVEQQIPRAAKQVFVASAQDAAARGMTVSKGSVPRKVAFVPYTA
jgi:hypothetical protein